MKLILESTDEIATLVTSTGEIPARVWKGQTEGGVECFAYITRLAVHKDADNSQFERELQEHRQPPGHLVIPLRLIL